MGPGVEPAVPVAARTSSHQVGLQRQSVLSDFIVQLLTCKCLWVWHEGSLSFHTRIFNLYLFSLWRGRRSLFRELFIFSLNKTLDTKTSRRVFNFCLVVLPRNYFSC